MPHAAQIQKYGAKLVGTPTGGNANFYANTKVATLPNSGIASSYSTQFHDTIPGYTNDSLYPDILTRQSLEQYDSGVDCDIQAVLAALDD